MITVSLVNKIFSVGIIAGQFFIVVAIIYLLFFRAKKSSVANFIARHGLLLAFVVALLSTAGSLFYSEIAGFEPCKLCWFQRIFMYPQVVLLGLALWKHDKNIRDYAIGLSGIGALIAGYHYLLQFGMAPSVACSAVGYSISCSKFFAVNFGYITIPMMALTAFVLIIIFLIFSRLVNYDKASR